MITRFASLFAGNLDLGNLGWKGAPVNDRKLSDERVATVFDKAQPAMAGAPADAHYVGVAELRR